MKHVLDEVIIQANALFGIWHENIDKTDTLGLTEYFLCQKILCHLEACSELYSKGLFQEALIIIRAIYEAFVILLILEYKLRTIDQYVDYGNLVWLRHILAVIKRSGFEKNKNINEFDFYLENPIDQMLNALENTYQQLRPNIRMAIEQDLKKVLQAIKKGEFECIEMDSLRIKITKQVNLIGFTNINKLSEELKTIGPVGRGISNLWLNLYDVPSQVIHSSFPGVLNPILTSNKSQEELTLKYILGLLKVFMDFLYSKVDGQTESYKAFIHKIQTAYLGNAD